jgi:uncharacterized protein DUF6847
MKLAEALALRSDASKRFDRLRSRAQASARYQEGEGPAENAAELLTEAGGVLDGLEDLIRRINRTDAATALDVHMTLTDAIARRDVLRMRHALFTAVADAAAGRDELRGFRQMRSELRYLTAVPVSELRAAADEMARKHRELDMQIQRANWEAELAD